MTPRPPLRAVVVGAGLMGRWHVDAIRRAGGVVVGVVDEDAGRARRLAAHVGAPAMTLDNALGGTGVTVAHVCTPLETHVDLARTILARGIHAIVEKPLAADASLTRQVLDEAGRKGLVLCPVHQMPFQSGFRRLLSALPRLGALLHVEAISCSAGAEGSPGDAAGRIADDILPHPLSLFAELGGAPLSAMTWCSTRPDRGEIVAMASTNRTSYSIRISMAGRPTRNALHVIAERGSAHLDLFHGYVVLEGGTVSRARKALRPFMWSAATIAAAAWNLSRRAAAAEWAYPGLRALVATCYASIRGEGPVPIEPDRVVDIARARDAILLASRDRA